MDGRTDGRTGGRAAALPFPPDRRRLVGGRHAVPFPAVPANQDTRKEGGKGTGASQYAWRCAAISFCLGHSMLGIHLALTITEVQKLAIFVRYSEGLV